MSTYAVGDLQGCLEPLQRLLIHVDFNPQKDSLWVAGDMVNRGPESLEVLRFLYRLGKSVKAVLGNHDIHMLAVAAGVCAQGASDTLTPILKAPDRDILLEWVRQQPLIYHEESIAYAMVHAGIPPQWSLKTAKKRAVEVEKILRSHKSERYLNTIYGNEPTIWTDDLKGAERWRLITNYFTRMRYCRADGQLELSTKSKAASVIAGGYRPWFAHKERKTAEDNIIFGHWAALEGRVAQKNVFALDTGYVWGGSLTLLRLEDKQRFSVSA